MSCALALFTHDLRVRDQPALSAAAREAERACRSSSWTRRCWLAGAARPTGSPSSSIACGPGRVEGELTPTGGDHYRVFTPYWRAWSQQPHRQPLAAPRKLALPSRVRGGQIPSLRGLCSELPSPDLPKGGETLARKRLDRWLRGGLAGYEKGHDSLAEDGTSQLSADLHFGLSPAAVLAREAGRPGGQAFVRQLCWRDFHHQVLAARPDLPHADYRGRGDRWRRGKRLAEAWRRGRTGYPIVDAGMRQLAREGFMHNRARMIVASFLTKTLYLDWRLGAAHFAGLLVDADVANNVGNWQWGGHRQRHAAQPGAQPVAAGVALRSGASTCGDTFPSSLDWRDLPWTNRGRWTRRCVASSTIQPR